MKGPNMRNAVLGAVAVALVVMLGANTDAEREGYAECAEMLDAGDYDAASCAQRWPDLAARARTLWGVDGDPETR